MKVASVTNATDPYSMDVWMNSLPVTLSWNRRYRVIRKAQGMKSVIWTLKGGFRFVK